MVVDGLTSYYVANIREAVEERTVTVLATWPQIHALSLSSLLSLLVLKKMFKMHFDLFTFPQQLFRFLSVHFHSVVRTLGS